jgi:hypothetical protein
MARNDGPAAPVHTFAEADYRFGIGPLRMTVDHVDWSNPVIHDGENWYEIAGIEVTSDGRQISPRQALVKGSRLSTIPRNRRT